MLAAIVQHANQGWFFKLTGSPEGLESHQDEFAAFVKSVRFVSNDDAQPRWDLPRGWRQRGPSGIRLATLLMGPEDRPLELTVTTLPKPSGQSDDEFYLANVNRWRGQLQLPPISRDKLSAETAAVSIDGARAVVIDFTGPREATATKPPIEQDPGENRGKSRMLAAIVPHQGQGWFFKLLGPDEAVAARAGEFEAFLKTVEFQEGHDEPRWQALPEWRKEPASGLRYATYRLGSNPPLELSIVRLPQTSDDLSTYVLSNVNRWRGQLQLPPISQSQLTSQTKELKLPGATATMVDISGTAAPNSMAPGSKAPDNRAPKRAGLPEGSQNRTPGASDGK
jgi:hypothetical protein